MTTFRAAPTSPVTFWNVLMVKARELHHRERLISLASVELVGELDHGNAALHLGISVQALARQIGLSPSMYFKRAQAARVMRSYPEATAMIEDGAIEISHVAALATKITPQNASLLLSGIRHKTKREVEQLLSIVTANGRLLEREEEAEIRATLTKSQLALLDRAREVLSHGGKVPTNAEVLVQALADLLKHRDPIAKAARAKKRQQMRNAAAAQPGAVQPKSAPGHNATTRPAPTGAPKRTPPPAAVRHGVALRDQGQCAAILADGSRCPERLNVERDHQIPVCRGGENTVENEQTRCRRHNRFRAERDIGAKYLVSWEDSRKRAGQRPSRPKASGLLTRNQAEPTSSCTYACAYRLCVLVIPHLCVAPSALTSACAQKPPT